MDCKERTVEFYDADTDQPLSSPFFEDLRSTDQTSNEFKVKKTTSVNDLGTYNIYYVVKQNLYGKQVRSDTFTVTIKDGCEEPFSLDVPTIAAKKSYSLTDTKISYVLPEFVKDP